MNEFKSSVTTKVELIMPVFNRREITLQALRSLQKINTRGLNVHIVVVDDGSSDGTGEAIAAEFPEVQVIRGDGSLHYAAGTNKGIRAALERNPDFIVTMNDDAVFHDDFLQRLIRTARENPHSVVGALLLLWNEPHRVFQVDFQWNTLKGGWQQNHDLSAFDFPEAPFEVEGMAGNCVLFPVDAITQCGLMDEDKFPHGWGDIQYLVRMRKRGWKLMVDPKSYVWCEPNTYPKPLHELKISEILKILFLDRKHPLNLQRQFIARWESAPSKPRALASYLVYLSKLTGKALKITPERKPG